jgi:hypothetical protein
MGHLDADVKGFAAKLARQTARREFPALELRAFNLQHSFVL